MVKSIGIIAIKGGVGKTTIASSLATDLANHYGKKVLLVDANFSAPNVGSHMDVLEPVKTVHEVLAGKAKTLSAIHTRYGVDVIPGDAFFNGSFNQLKLRDRIDSVKDNYDFVVIDSSPSLNDEVLSTILASDSLFVVTTPDHPTLNCSIRAAQLVKHRGKPVSGIIVNKIRDPAYEFTLKDLEESLDIPVVARLPDEKNAVRSLYTRIPLPLYKRNSAFSKEISRLSAAICGQKERKSIFGFLFPAALGKETVNRQVLREDFYKSVF